MSWLSKLRTTWKASVARKERILAYGDVNAEKPSSSSNSCSGSVYAAPASYEADRRWIVDRGAHYDLISAENVTAVEDRTRYDELSAPMASANGVVQS